MLAEPRTWAFNLAGSLQHCRKDGSRKKKMSNTEWTHPHDPDTRVTKLKDGLDYCLQFNRCDREEEYRTL